MDRTRPPNDRLVHWLDRSGYNNSRLARLIRQRATAQGHRHVQPDARRVRAWRQGEHPRAPIPQILAEVLGERLRVRLAPADLGLDGVVHPPQWYERPWTPVTVLSELTSLTRSDLMLGRRDVEHSTHTFLYGEGLLAAARPWITTAPEPLSTVRDRTYGRIGHGEVDQLQAVTQALRALDNLHGGGLAREAVVGQLTWATSLLDSATYTEAVGRRLFAAVGDLAGVAGWMCHDANLHTAAQHYFLLALRAAKEAGDASLGAHILNCMARQAGHLDRPDDALELVHLALYGARRSATPTIRAILHSLEARYYATMGERGGFTRAAGQAEAAFSDRDPAADPVWVAFFDSGEYHATLGVCHQITARAGHPHHAERAIAMLGQAISQRGAGRTRSLAFDHIGLARAYLVAGELDAVRDTATTGLGLLDGLSSTRVRDRLGELYRETTPHSSVPAISDLREALRHHLHTPPPSDDVQSTAKHTP